MNYTEELSAQLESRGTFWGNATTMNAPATALLTGQRQRRSLPHSIAANSLSVVSASETFQTTRPEEDVSYRDLFDALNNIYNQLLSNQVEMDPESKRILYANLWNLYE